MSICSVSRAIDDSTTQLPRRCVVDLVCHPTFEHDACVSPDQLDACAGQPDELLCELDPSPRAWCIDGLCRPAWCGDGRIGPTETCEESWANPESCVDYRGYDYGRLESPATASLLSEGCRRPGFSELI